MYPTRIPLRKHTNEKPGYLVAFEPPDIGIEFKRVFYITGFKDDHTMRGFHGHYTTTQFLVCIRGTASVQAGSETFQLVDDSDGLLIPPNHFIVMDLSQDAMSRTVFERPSITRYGERYSLDVTLNDVISVP